MFDSVRQARVIARFDELVERRYPSRTAESAALLERIGVASRGENRAAAAQLAAVGELFAIGCRGVRRPRTGRSTPWRRSPPRWPRRCGSARALAARRVRYARALRERLPQVGEVFKAGRYRLSDVRHDRVSHRSDHRRRGVGGVDAALAANVARWPSMTRGRLAGQVDKIVASADADAVRGAGSATATASCGSATSRAGSAEIEGSLLGPDAHALDKRLDALAATVCAHDPRSREQRRADALGALAAGADRLGCRCGRPDCAAGTRPAASPVVIHVIAEQATLGGAGGAPASEVGADGLISPELVAELAKSAKLVPLIHPGDAPPEPGYVPSKALAAFVRCRDLTCRWPGCDAPAIGCDLDHTIPYAQGGPTHAGNLSVIAAPIIW